MEKHMIQVGEVMTRKPVIIKKGSTLQQAAVLLQKNNVSSVLVVNGVALEGILTTDDIVYRVVAKGKSVDLLVEDVMTKGLYIIDPTQSLDEAMSIINENDVRQLPVVQNGKLVGILTLKDIIRIEPALMDLVVERARNQEEERQKFIQKYAHQDINEDLFN